HRCPCETTAWCGRRCALGRPSVVTAGCPWMEFVGVADGPDAFDPVVCYIERHHRGCSPVHLDYQTRLTIDSAFQDRQAGSSAGEVDKVAGDPFAALDRAERSIDQAAAVGDPRGVGIEEADEGIDVLGFPCLFEVPDDIG